MPTRASFYEPNSMYEELFSFKKAAKFLYVGFVFVWMFTWLFAVAISPVMGRYFANEGPEWYTKSGVLHERPSTSIRVIVNDQALVPEQTAACYIPSVLTCLLLDAVFFLLAFAPYNGWYVNTLKLAKPFPPCGTCGD